MKLTRILLIALLFTINACYGQSNIIIKNEIIEEFNVDVYTTDDDYTLRYLFKSMKDSFSIFIEGVTKDDITKAADIIEFIDFNFDKTDEIVFTTRRGMFIYHRKSGKPVNFFTGTYQGEIVNPENIGNYINIERGSYDLNDKNKTIKIWGSCGAECHESELYKANDDGSVKLIKRYRGK